MKVANLHFWCDLRHLPAPSLRRLVFGFRGVKELNLYRFNGHQLADDLLRECALRHISSVAVADTTADPGPPAVSDEGVLDYLYAPEYGMPNRELILPAFHASPQFVSKLVEVSKLSVQQQRLIMRVSGYTTVPWSVPSWTLCASIPFWTPPHAGLRGVPARAQHGTARKNGRSLSRSSLDGTEPRPH